MRALTADVFVTVAGQDLPVVRGRIVEEIDAITEARITVASKDDVDFGPALGGAASVVLRIGQNTRSWTLVLGSAAFTNVDAGRLEFELSLYSPLWMLTHTKNTRKFRNLDAQQIVTAVLSEGGIPHRWRLMGTPPTRKYCVQYRESNLAFVRRMLAFEGIYFTTDQDGVLVLEDSSPGAAAIQGQSSFRLIESEGSLEADELAIHRFGKGARVSTGGVAVNDFSWKSPAVDLLQSVAGDRDAELEVYDYPAGYRKPGQGAAIAARYLEGYRARTQYRGGRGNVATMEPGRAFTFEGRFGGELLLDRIEHELAVPAHQTGEAHQTGQAESASDGQATYRNRFRAIPKAVPYRPAPVLDRPQVQGCHDAVVVGPPGEEIHTDKYGRFRAKFHWDREAKGTDEDSRWVRKLQEVATSMNLARVGWEVSVVYVDGDPDRPIGLARNINGPMPPTYGMPGNMPRMTIKSPSYPSSTGGFNEIRLDDRADAMEMYIKAERDMMNQVEHDRTEKVGHDQSHFVGGGLANDVERHRATTVGNDRTRDIGLEAKVQVDGDRTVSVGANETIDIGGARVVTIEGNDTEAVGAVRLTIAGSIKPPDIAANAKGMVPDPKAAAKGAGQAAMGSLKSGGGLGGAASAAGGSLKSMVPTPAGAANQLTGGLASGDLSALATGAINRTVKKALTRCVGGALIAVAGDSQALRAQHVMAELVGGAKIVAAKGSIGQKCAGPMALTVGGAILRKCDESMGVKGDTCTVTVGGLCSMVSDEKFSIQSTAITLEALSSMELKSGDLTIKLEPAKVTVAGEMHLVAGDAVQVSGKDDNLTKGG